MVEDVVEFEPVVVANDDPEAKLKQAVLHFRFLTQRPDDQIDVCLQHRKKYEYRCCCDKYPNLD